MRVGACHKEYYGDTHFWHVTSSTAKILFIVRINVHSWNGKTIRSKKIRPSIQFHGYTIPMLDMFWHPLISQLLWILLTKAKIIFRPTS